MVKAPPGVSDVIAPALEDDENLVAATFADNRSLDEQAVANITGEVGVRLNRLVGTHDDVPVPPGLAGQVRYGEVLVAATDRRVLVFPRQGMQLFTPMVAYGADDLAHVTWHSRLLGPQTLEIRFTDGSRLTLGLPTSNFGKHVAQAGTHLCEWVPPATSEPID